MFIELFAAHHFLPVNCHISSAREANDESPFLLIRSFSMTSRISSVCYQIKRENFKVRVQITKDKQILACPF